MSKKFKPGAVIWLGSGGEHAGGGSEELASSIGEVTISASPRVLLLNYVNNFPNRILSKFHLNYSYKSKNNQLKIILGFIFKYLPEYIIQNISVR